MTTPERKLCPDLKSNLPTSTSKVMNTKTANLLPFRTATWLALLAPLLAAASSAWAQTTVRIFAEPTRTTVPINTGLSNGAPFTVTVGGTPGTPIHLSQSSLPGGVTSLVDTNDFFTNAVGVLTLNTTNVPEGLYTFSFDATGGATTNLLLELQSAHVWTGADQTNAISTNWTSAGNWVGNAVPNSSSDVVFNDSATVAQADATTNVLISGNTEIASLRFAQATARRHNLQLDSARLLVSGQNGLSVLRDRSDVNNAWRVFFTGLGGSLVVSNKNADVKTFVQGNQQGYIDMSGLGSFVADVRRFGICDYRLYPNYDSLKANNYDSSAFSGGDALPRRMTPGLRLARTNFITATFPGDANSYADPAFRDYAFVYGRNETGGSGTRQNLYFGISNAFYLSSACFFGAGTAGEQAANNVFNPNLIASNCIVVFRNTNDTRLPMLAIADGAAPGASGTGTKGRLNFNGGRVDALVDRLYMGRERTNSTGATVQALLDMSGGTFDVNTVILGFQGQGDNQGTGLAYCQGTLNINTTAVFRVNNTLTLGYTTASAAHTTGAEQGYGQININDGGSLYANSIDVGGVTKISVNNNISLSRGGNLTLTNTAWDAAGPLNQLSLADASSLTLFINGATGTNIIVRNLATTGVGPNQNIINIASVSGISSYPTNIPIIAYLSTGSGASFAPGFAPSGLVPSLNNDTANGAIVLTLSTTPPRTLVWRGNTSSTWDTVATNWVTQVGGIPTRFIDGDFVVFDDTATGSTSVNIPGTVIPGQSITTPGILVSNSAMNYTLGGSGLISGTATARKVGSGTLTVNGTMQPSMDLAGGALAGTGTIGATVAGYGTTLTGFSGAINGGLACSNATVSIPGGATISGQVALRAGSMANAGTVTGTLALQPGTLLVNGGTINVTVPWTIPTNSAVVNNGTIVQSGPTGGNNGLTVGNGGTLMGVGKITTPGTIALSDARVTIGNGGQLIIGNSANEITNVTIATRLDFLGGSTNYFDVNLSAGNDFIRLTDGFIVGKVNFGQNNTLGGTLYINRLGATPFTTASVLYLFDVTANSPDNTIPAVPGIRPPPGPGLIWNYSDMLTNLTLRVATGLPFMTNSTTSTNITFSWGSFYKGWHLEVNTNDLVAGPWEVVSGSWSTNLMTVPIESTNPPTFYRLAYP